MNRFLKNNFKAILAGDFFVLFLLLIVLLKTVGVETDPATGCEIGLSSLNFAVRDAITLKTSLYDITDFLGWFAIAFGVAIGAWAGVRLLLFRFSFKKMGYCFLALGALYMMLGVIYLFFELVAVNYRPVLWEGEIASSFPSSHTVLGTVVFGSAPEVFHRFFGHGVPKPLFSLPFWLLAILLPVLRLLSGVHWMTDIIGGSLLSLSLLFLFSFVLDKLPAPASLGEN